MLSADTRSIPPPIRPAHTLRIPLHLADDVPRVDNARDPAQDAQQYVDEEISLAPSPQEDGYKRDKDGEEVEENGAL